MQPLRFSVLLAMYVCLAAQMPAPACQNGAAIVVNHCNFTVYFKSVDRDAGALVQTIAAGETYQEQYRLNIYPDGTIGGVSIKLTPNQSIANAASMSAAFDESTITQFEYTFDPNIAPGLWYDISNVNGYLNTMNGTWPFDMYGGLILKGTGKCPTLVCPGSTRICKDAYTKLNDDWATHGCQNNNSLILTLCSAASDLSAVEAVTSRYSTANTLPTKVATTPCL